MSSSTDGSAVLVDGHAHVYDCHDPATALAAAWRHMVATAARRRLNGGWQGCLIVAGTDRALSPRRLAERLNGGWRVEPTAEPESVIVHHPGGARLLLAGGRQLVTAERLEVIALGDAGDDGLPLAETVARVTAAGGPAILPWGFGKWRRLSPAMLEALWRAAPGRLLLGDNRGRPPAPGAPWPFRWAARNGVPVLPGSDPLPLPDHGEVAGSYGFILPGRLDPERPAASLRRRLGALTGQPQAFGRRVSLAGFCHDQWRLRTASHAG